MFHSSMWQQNYTPLADSLAVSAIVAALPIFVLLILLGIVRKPAYIAGLCGLGTALLVSIGGPVRQLNHRPNKPSFVGCESWL